jgi:hypothetical protein
MGIFDIFTGESARRAAEENSARINANLATGTSAINTGQTNAIGSLDAAAGAYAPMTELARKYSGGTDMFLNALGLNGPGGSAAASTAFQNNPGYSGAITAGLDVINRRRAAGGMLNSGNADQDAQVFGQNLQNQQYGSWLQNLAGINQNALTATGAATSGIAGANANKAGVYQNTANSIVGLNNNATTGLNDQNTQAANAAMAGSKNLWGFGLAAAQTAMGMPGGWGSALGGSTPDYGQSQNVRVGNYNMPMFGRYGS